MIKKPITIQLSSGMEVKPVDVLVQAATQYNSRIYFESADKKVNAKSIMGMMSFGFHSGEQIIISADGPDETEAVMKMENFLTESK